MVPVGIGGEVADGGPDGGGGDVDGGRAVPGPDAFVAGDARGFEAGERVRNGLRCSVCVD